MTYRVKIYENSHYMDESESHWLPREFSDCESAVAACRRIVDDFLLGSHRPGMSADDLWRQYTSFGEDPFITPPDCAFSAWDYARRRCGELCPAAEEP
jgi:hypothetical protein